MAYSKLLKVDELRRLAFGAMGINFTAIGTALEEPCRIFILKNLTNTNLIFSLDGATDHFYLPSGGFELIDGCTNAVRDEGFFVPIRTIFYVRHEVAAPPASGIAAIEIIHG